LTVDFAASKYAVRLGGNVRFGASEPAVRATDAVQLPKTGNLVIRMRDGSVHTINLADVQSVKLQ